MGQQVVELLGSTTVELHDFLDRLAVLAAQLDEELPSGADRVEPFGVGFDLLGHGPQLIDDVGQLGEEPVQPCRCRRERRPVLDGGERSGHEVGGGTVVVEPGEGAGAGLEVGQGIGQEVLFGGQAFVLGRIVDRRGIELVDLEPEEVDFAGPGPFVASERCQLRFELAAPGLRHDEGREVDRPEPVEGVALRPGRLETLVGVLTADLDEPTADLGEPGGGGHLAVHVATRAPLGGNDAAEDDLVVVGTGLAGHREPTLDHARLGSGANPGGIGLATQQQCQRLDDHGLAGTGLARERAHSGPEVEAEIGDHTEVTDGELEQHWAQR